MNKILAEEKEYLDYTKNNLEKKINYYEKELNEIPRRYTKALQGDTFLVEGLMTIAATQLRKLELSKDCPYFGRIDFLADDTKELSKIYIGKTNITDELNKSVTTDWRAPICSLYYDSINGKASYEAPHGTINGDLELKRQIIIKDGKLIDALDTSIVSNDDLLQPYLSVSADNKMKTIIASIQKEQNNIIRKQTDNNMIIQGVAGSGKTSVALHRIAYLIYNLKNQISSNQFLVLGPNRYFLDYISSILPELETEPVDQKTYFDFVKDLTKSKIKEVNLENISTIDLESKFINKYKSSLMYKDTINKFFYFYKNESIVSNGFILDGTVIFSKEEIKNKLFSSLTGLPNFETTTKYFVNKYKENREEIFDKLNKKYRDVYIKLPKGNPNRQIIIEKSEELSKQVKEKGVKLLKDYFKSINLSAVDIYKQFINNIELYEFNIEEKYLKKLQNETITNLKKNKISFVDLPAILYIDKLIHGSSNQYKYVVIDEAQDYGLFHFSSIKEKFPNSKFSIYGDLAQSIHCYRSIENWESVISNIFNDECELLFLNKSYRTTIEITNNANYILDNMMLKNAEPVVRHGKNINFNNETNNLNYKIKKICDWLENGYKTIAIICKTEKEALNTYQTLLNKGINVTFIDNKDNKYKGGVFVLTSENSKGLEFDAVILNDASDNIYDISSPIDMHMLYVACTRALHELDILYNKSLCKVFEPNNKSQNYSKKLIK